MREKNVFLRPFHPDEFLTSMASSAGVLCNAGFGTASEALFLQKKLMVIPMKTQYEQNCNAVMLKSMGVAVIKKLKEKNYPAIESWLSSDEKVAIDYPDITATIIDTIIANHAGKVVEMNFERSQYALFQ